MSEEILKALMELFAILTKQDGGLSDREKSYVKRFLVQQIGEEQSEPYFNEFLEIATPNEGGDKKKLTSVLDSVKILRIGKKIGKTLDTRQKIVVLVRALELICTEYTLTDQRLSIVDTIAEVFKVDKQEYQSMIDYVHAESKELLDNEQILLIRNERHALQTPRSIIADGIDTEIRVLRVPSVELYFMRYSGELSLQLNGNTIVSGAIYLLANGSSIRPPTGHPIYYSDIASAYFQHSSKERILLEADRLHYTFPGNVTGLEDIRFQAEQGNLIGIMGASGAGKTTLLNVLAGIYTPSKGSVKINGFDYQKEPEKLEGVMGYVPQDDLLIEELTVFENLYYNAKFCFSGVEDDEIRKRVEETLESLGLLEKKDLTVGSPLNKTISGGQRKRLNIALELIRQPAVLFLDEPTSGLSSRDSENVMDLLRELTIRGKLIFIVIHQPSSDLYKMFDRMIILDQGGKMVYYGNPVEAVIHFRKIDNQINYTVGECNECGNVNPEQIFNIMEAQQLDEFGNYSSQRKISPARWKEIFEQHRPKETLKKVLKPPPVSLKIPGWFGQFFNYLKRDLKSKLANRQYLVLVLGTSPLLAIILSYIIRYIADPTSKVYIFRENENIPIYIFMAIIVALFLGLIMAAEEIFRDRKILKREKFLHLSRSAYLGAKILNVLLMSAFQTIVFVLIANTVLGMGNMILPYWFALFSVAAAANMIGLIISSAFNSAVTIYILIPLVMIPMMVLSGAMFSFEKLNRAITSVNRVPAIAEVMPTRWAYEALMVKQFKDNPFERNFFDVEREISRTNFKSAYYIPELEERLSTVNDEFSETGSLQESLPALNVLKNEILREQDSLGSARFSPEDLVPENYSADLSSDITRYLSNLNNFYLKQFIVANRTKQRLLNEIMKDRRELYYELLNQYHNESVSDRVKKIYEKNKIVESDGRLFQQTDPIFLLPASFRAHFYAPAKRVFGLYVDTYLFNMIVIWLTSLLLYLVLYFDLLRKIIEAPLFKKRIRYKLRA